MGVGASLFIFAAGAVLAFAVETSVEGIELSTVGWILMVVGAVGLLLSLAFWSSFSPWGSPGRRRTVVEERDSIDVLP